MTVFGDVREFLYETVKRTVHDPEPRDQGERTLVARMAMHGYHWLQSGGSRLFPADMMLDGEYSRAGMAGRKQRDDGTTDMYLDLILHHRMDPTGNLFVAEVKRLPEGHRRARRPHQGDWARLGELTTDNAAVLRERGYRVAAAVTIDAPEQRAWVWWRTHEAVHADPRTLYFATEVWTVPWFEAKPVHELDPTVVWPS